MEVGKLFQQKQKLHFWGIHELPKNSEAHVHSIAPLCPAPALVATTKQLLE